MMRAEDICIARSSASSGTGYGEPASATSGGSVLWAPLPRIWGARMFPSTLPTTIFFSVLGTAFTLASAQHDVKQAPPCDLATLFTHLADIQGACCVEGNECSSGYPGADDACGRDCGELFEPFWDSEC